MKFLYAVTALAATAAAIDCSAKELANYNFQAAKGVYLVEVTKDTPPSKQHLRWSVGICQNVDSESDCPKNLDVCGTTRVEVDKTSVLAEVIGFSSSLQKTYTPFTDLGVNKESGVSVGYKNANWGDNLVDGSILFVCVDAKDSSANQLKLVKWDGAVFEGEFRTPAACANKKGKAPSLGSDRDDTGETWGWFTWIFIFMVLFLSIYIIGGAWFQYNKGNLIDFQLALKEVVENFVDLLRGLPAFFREIVEKVTGNSSRGEYSAV